MAVAYISLGSNIGDRLENCNQALRLMNTGHTQVLQVSSFYHTSPVGYTDQPDFINAAARIQTDLKPLELLDLLQQIEQSLGKNITVRWGPRSIDLDIVLYDNLIVNQGRLQIPHPRMLERGFVLIPLAEIAPELIHPVAKKTIAELAKNVGISQAIKKIEHMTIMKEDTATIEAKIYNLAEQYSVTLKKKRVFTFRYI